MKDTDDAATHTPLLLLSTAPYTPLPILVVVFLRLLLRLFLPRFLPHLKKGRVFVENEGEDEKIRIHLGGRRRGRRKRGKEEREKEERGKKEK